MKTNILKAVIKMTCIPCMEIKKFYNQSGRAESIEDCVKEYIKDCFCDTIREKSDERRKTKIDSDFSYDGGYPTLSIKEGDAVVLSIIDEKDKDITLPKPVSSSLTKDSADEELKAAEDFDEKDIIYITAVVKDCNLSALYIVYGEDYINYTEPGTVCKNPSVAMKEIFTKRAGGKYEILFAISNKKYATLHMQNRLEIETLARAGRGLEMSDIKIGDKDMKVFFTDIG